MLWSETDLERQLQNLSQYLEHASAQTSDECITSQMFESFLTLYSSPLLEYMVDRFKVLSSTIQCPSRAKLRYVGVHHQAKIYLSMSSQQFVGTNFLAYIGFCDLPVLPLDHWTMRKPQFENEPQAEFRAIRIRQSLFKCAIVLWLRCMFVSSSPHSPAKRGIESSLRLRLRLARCG